MKINRYLIFVTLILQFSTSFLLFGQNHHQFVQSNFRSNDLQTYWEKLKPFFSKLEKWAPDIHVIAIQKQSSKVKTRYQISDLDPSIDSIDDFDQLARQQLNNLFNDGINIVHLNKAIDDTKNDIEYEFPAYSTTFKRHRNLLWVNSQSFIFLDNVDFWIPWISSEDDISKPLFMDTLNKRLTDIGTLAFYLLLADIKPLRFDTFLQTELPYLITFWEQIRSFLIKFAIDQLPSKVVVPSDDSNNDYSLSGFKYELREKIINFKDLTIGSKAELQDLIDHKIDFASFKKAIEDLSLPQVISPKKNKPLNPVLPKPEKDKPLLKPEKDKSPLEQKKTVEKAKSSPKWIIGLGATGAIVVFTGSTAAFTWWFVKIKKW